MCISGFYIDGMNINPDFRRFGSAGFGVEFFLLSPSLFLILVSGVARGRVTREMENLAGKFCRDTFRGSAVFSPARLYLTTSRRGGDIARLDCSRRAHTHTYTQTESPPKFSPFTEGTQVSSAATPAERRLLLHKLGKLRIAKFRPPFIHPPPLPSCLDAAEQSPDDAIAY